MYTTDKQRKARKAKERRAFLKLAGAGAAAGGMAAVLQSETVAGVEAAAEQKAGYRETAHVKKFYETARF